MAQGRDDDAPRQAELRDAHVSGSVIQAGEVHGDVHFHAARSGGVTAPRELPPSPAHFTDREPELAELDRLAGRAGERAGALVAVVGGTAGVGKTALLLHWLHRERDRYPDGQLYADLHGFSSVAPTPPADVLGRFLRALGVAPERVPVELDERATLFRTLTAGRRISILADNAVSAAQVRTLLPGHGPSAVAVTSRRPIRGLAHEGAGFIDLAPLDQRSATELLDRLLGDERVRSEPEAARDLAGLCGHLPIAIRVTAARLARRRFRTLEQVVRDLADERHRLAALSTDDDVTVRAVFDLSYAALDAGAAGLYRGLGIFPGPHFTVPAAAALLDADTGDCERRLDEVVNAGLADEIADGRFRLHDLVRLHAAEKAARLDGDDDRSAALDRLISWYLATAASADLVILPGRWRIGPAFVTARRAPARFTSSREALGWLEAELPNLLALLRAAAESGRHDGAWQLCEALWGLFLFRRHYREWVAAHEIGLASARSCGDRVAEARMLAQLGRARLDMGDADGAERDFSGSLDAARSAGQRIGEATALQHLGLVRLARGEPDQAVSYFGASRDLHADLGEDRGVALLTRRIGEAHRAGGRHAEAVTHLADAVARFDAMGDRYNTIRSLIALAETHLLAARPRDALPLLERAGEAARSVGARYEEARTCVRRADALAALGETSGVRAPLEQALAIFIELDAPEVDAVRERLGTLATPASGAPAEAAEPAERGEEQVDE